MRIVVQKIDEGLASLPSMARVVAMIGVPSAIAIFLVLFICTSVTDAERHSLIDHAKMQDKLTMLATEFEIFDKTQSETNRQMVQLQLMMCLHTSKTDQERNECIGVTAPKGR